MCISKPWKGWPSGVAPSTASRRFSAVISVVTSRWPRPGTVPGGPSTPGGVGDLAAEHLVAGAEAEDAAAAAEVGGDVDVEAGGAEGARSAMVDLEPGRRMRSASPGRGVPGQMRRSSTWGSAARGSRSSKLAMRGRMGTAMRMGPPVGAVGARARASSAGRRRAGSKKGTRPMGRQPVWSAMVAMPSAKRVGSPRKRLTMKAFIRAASAGSRTACVPTRLAMTPPRSMSPMRTTGVSVARAKPMLAMSLARRLVSEALPAPSTRTRSASAERVAKLSRTWGRRVGLRAW